MKDFRTEEHRQHNINTKVEVGNYFYTKNGDRFEVVGVIPAYDPKYPTKEAAYIASLMGKKVQEKPARYLVRFNTGKIKEVSYASIRGGEVKNTSYASVYDMGIVGDVDKKKYYRHYQLWRDMLHRCTSEFQEKHPAYAGTTCCTRWLKLENFIEDITKFNGYDEWFAKEGKMSLDKDLLGNGEKHYSPETCCFLPLELNISIGGVTTNGKNTRD